MEESLRNISVTNSHMTSAGEGEMVNEFQLINTLVSSWTCPTCVVSALHKFKFTEWDSDREDLFNGHYSSHERRLLDFFYT